MHSNEVVAVVVTYNRKELLSICLDKLLTQSSRCDILVIDNGSTDGTKEYINDKIEKGLVLYKNTGDNLGGAGGFNYGLKQAVKEGYKYAWIMDDDTFPFNDSLEKLLKADRELDGTYGYLSSVALWTDGSLCNMNYQRVTPYKLIESIPEQMLPIVMATFVSFFVRIEVIKEIGLPIADFFIWADDLEYSRRISMKYPCYLVPDSRVEHHMASNNKVGIEAESEDRLWRYKYLYRNEVYVFGREGIKGYIYLLLRFCLHNFRIITKAKECKKEKLKAIRQSFFGGFKFNPDIEYIEN
ncbi:MAG: glycosyltransferase family 2 protein [Eubacterium sp.]|nr:glycosyltransferase family 2 protein [Eubacterium sp.]